MEISEVLIRRGLITPEQRDQAREQNGDRSLDQIVVDMGFTTEEETLQALADEFGMRYMDLKDFEVDHELVKLFPTSVIFRHSLLPLRRQNGSVEVATSDPLDLEPLDELLGLGQMRQDSLDDDLLLEAGRPLHARQEYFAHAPGGELLLQEVAAENNWLVSGHGRLRLSHRRPRGDDPWRERPASTAR